MEDTSIRGSLTAGDLEGAHEGVGFAGDEGH